MSTCELFKEFGCEQKTAWLFKAKLQQALKSNEQFDLSGCVEVDELIFTDFAFVAPVFSPDGKFLVVLAVDLLTDKKEYKQWGWLAPKKSIELQHKI